MTHRTNLTLTSLLLHHQKVEQFVQKPDLRNCHIWLSRSNMTSLTLRFSWCHIYEALMWPKWKFKTFDACEKNIWLIKSKTVKECLAISMPGGSTIKHPPKVSEQAHLNRRAIGYLHISSLGELDINCVPIFHCIKIIHFDFISFLPMSKIQYIWSTIFVVHHLMY